LPILARRTPGRGRGQLVPLEKGYEMTIEEAKRLVGNQDTVSLRNMKKALELPISRFMNTAEDWQRLEAVKVILKSRKGKK
jgi:hypothetical protein